MTDNLVNEEVTQETSSQDNQELTQETSSQVNQELNQELEKDSIQELDQNQEQNLNQELNQILEQEIEPELKNNQEIPKWNPDENDYNPKNEQKVKKEKSNKIWVVPAIIGGSLIIVAVIIALAFGLPKNKTASSNSNAVITTTDTNKKDESTKLSNGYVLTDVSGVVQEVMPAVVGVTSRTIVNYYQNNPNSISDIWNYFFGGFGGNDIYGNIYGDGNPYGNNNPAEGQEVDSGLGSGTIISKNDKELLILTSYHVVENCSSLYVTFTDGNAVDGTIKAASEEKDIAVVAVPLNDIPEETMSAIKIATLSSTDVNVGEGCIVIGNALGYGMSVTTGIISALNRELVLENNTMSLIQTDAAINNGNSGGCMLNARGEVIGISEAKLIDSAVEGMCYAIPISTNSELIQNLLNGNSEIPIENKDAQGGYLGIQGKDVDQSLAAKYDMPQGIYVAGTVKGSGAEKAGLKEGDIIVGIDKVTVLTMDSLKEQLAKYNPKDKVTLSIMRKDKNQYKQTEVVVELTSMLS